MKQYFRVASSAVPVVDSDLRRLDCGTAWVAVDGRRLRALLGPGDSDSRFGIRSLERVVERRKRLGAFCVPGSSSLVAESSDSDSFRVRR